MNDMQINELKHLIDDAELVSFDVFDTMLLRIVNTPETIFSCIGDYFGMENFKKYRMDMQVAASEKAEKDLGWPHPTLDQIYNYIECEATTPYDELNINWQEVKDLELQMEYDALRVNSEIKELYDYAKEKCKRIVAISDMYLETDFLQRVLYDNGYYLDAIYDSANIHKTKWVGDIYQYVIGVEGISAAHIVHIGDNEKSDYDIARNYGINAYHYVRGLDNNEEYTTSSSVLSVGYGVFNCITREDVSFWHKLGAKVGGPLYLGLMQWFSGKLKKAKYDKIYFMSRDGYNLYNLYKRYTKEPAEYVYTSRRALLLAGITELNKESLAILPPFTHGQTIRDVFEYLGVVDIYSDCVSEMGYESIDDVISEDDVNSGRFKGIYCLKEEDFLKVCEEERKSAEKYFRGIGFYDCDSIVFDCGWNGSSQYLLDRFLKSTSYNKNNMFLYTGIIDTPKSRFQIGRKDFEAYLFDYDNNHILQDRVRDNIVLLELFFGSPEQSIYKYEAGKPIFDQSDTNSGFKQELLDGIVQFIECAYLFVQKYNIEVSLENAVFELMRLIEKPTTEEAKEVGDLPNDDTFAKREGVDVKIGYLTEKQYEEGINIDTFWVQGFLKREDVDIKLKKLVCFDKGLDFSGYVDVEIPEDEKELSEEQLMYRRDMIKASYESRSYTKWFRHNCSKNEQYIKQQYEPLISVVIPVYNVVDYQLIECIESICNQTYEKWELFLVDDNSSWESVREVLRGYENNPRINVIYRKENGNISIATNDGIFAASGEFIAFIDCDDCIESKALAEMVYYLNDNPETDFIYSDEDKISEDSTDLHNPFFKPDWSPDTILSVMYTNHLAIYRREIVCKVGGLRTEYNGAQDYDFTLRFMEHSNNKRVGHVPKVLYHWRERPESVASSMEAKPYALDAMKRLKEDALRRRGITGEVEFLNDLYQYRINYGTEGNPLVSIIIPSKDNPMLLQQCIDSIVKYTEYKNYEVIVVDNGSSEFNKRKISDYLQRVNALYIYEEMDFNYSRMCNMGVEASKGEYILLLNDDVEVIKKDWLGRMLGQAMQVHTGAVGAKLLYPNSNYIQHIGISNLPVGPCHMFMGFSDSLTFYYGRNRLNYNWLAVTGACLLVAKEKYCEVGGLDEKLTVAYNDVDLCFNLYKAGYYNVSRMDATLYHHESFSRGYDDVTPEKKDRLKKERDRLYGKHSDLFAKDPFHNVNFGVDRIDYEINMYGVDVCNYNVVLSKRKYKPKATSLQLHIDEINKDDMVRIRGWAFSNDSRRDLQSKRYLMLKNKANQIYVIPVNKTPREDLSLICEIDNLTEGFECNIDRKILATNVYSYDIGILQVQPNGKEDWIWSDKKVPHDGIEEVDYKFYSREEVIDSFRIGKKTVCNIDESTHEINVVTKYGSFRNMTRFRGWAYVPKTKSCDYRIEIGVSEGSKREVMLFDTIREPRYDLATTTSEENNYLSGFRGEIPYKLNGDLKTYLVLTDMRNNKRFIKSIVLNKEQQ